MSNPAVTAAGPVVEKFAPSAGRWMGWLGVALGVAIMTVAAAEGATNDWSAFGIGAAIVLVSWVVLIRPSVSVHPQGLLLRNMVRDTYLPFSTIDRCRAAQTLMVSARGRTFHGLGVSRSARSIIREKRGGRPSAFGALSGISGGFGGVEAPEPTHRFANEEQTGGTYSEYVESRVMTAAQTQADDGREPVVAVDGVALGAVVVAALALIIPLVL